ncbi:MAG: hypothetical protein P4K86_04850 [Terracidiphilus sp.]|nr:hypothetical protein [Terracidiphilus sp.]
MSARALSKRRAYIKAVCLLSMTIAITFGPCAARAQRSLLESFGNHNTEMSRLQPTWMGPLIQSDARLVQGLRVSYANSYSPGTQTMNYGNNHGFSVIAGHRLQFDFVPPSFFRNHSATLKDGFGNAVTQIKVCIASGNAQHGNFALTAMLGRSFSPRSYQNMALTGAYNPKLAAGKSFGRFDVQTTLGAQLPTGQTAAQGRTIEWNIVAQVHSSSHVWFDIENNAALIVGSPLDGTTMNFITPAAFYMIRPRHWSPQRPAFVIDGGMQIATTKFYPFNHNLIVEERMFF